MLIACAVFVASAVRALDDVTLDIDRVAGDGWAAEGLSIRLDMGGEITALATVERVTFPGAPELREVRLRCARVELSEERIACPQAHLDARLDKLKLEDVAGRLVYGRGDGSLELDLIGIRVAEGTTGIRLVLRDAAWESTIKLERVRLEPLAQLARDWQALLPELSVAGEISGVVRAIGKGELIREVELDTSVRELTANNEEGSVATDTLSLQVKAHAQRDARVQDDWIFRADAGSDAGQAYVQPVFLDLTARPAKFTLEGEWRDGRRLRVSRFSLDHREVAIASGSANIDLEAEMPLRDLALDLSLLRFPGAYEAYLQPFLLATSFKSMQTAGAISGRVEIADGQPQRIDLDFDDVTFDDGARNLALGGLSGSWHWRDRAIGGADDDDADERAPPSRLGWRDGTVLGLALGETTIHFSTEGRQIRLLEPARIPVLDGAIELDSFRVRNAGTPTVAFIVDATLRPISVERLCDAFGWPRFGGRVSGVISKLRMRDGVVTLGTTLQAQVFDGEVSISDLRLEQPFGQWPRMYASIALENLDLALVTGAFSFGLITGRLSGAIDDLELFNWTPVAFDARLFTPPGDRSRHRISQRAVENIGSMGGSSAGVTAALSSGFLRFFEEFNYDRLGISCRLENEVCHMDGVAPAANGGYYLIKGRGLPRIDVIGNSRRVDWPRLVQQLIAVTQSEGPQVR